MFRVSQTDFTLNSSDNTDCLVNSVLEIPIKSPIVQRQVRSETIAELTFLFIALSTLLSSLNGYLFFFYQPGLLKIHFS